MRWCYATCCSGTRNEYERAAHTEDASEGDPLRSRVMKVVIQKEKEKMTESTIVTFDVRGMTPGERHQAIVARLDALQLGETLRLVSDHDPAPLYAQLLAEHPNLFAWELEQEGPEAWVIRIQKRGQDGDAPSRSAEEGYAHETSHVIQCMQCGLQFQAEAVTVRHEGAQEEQLVRLRLPVGSSPAQRAMAEQLYERVEGGGTRMLPLTQPL
jgi:uncharacterized protein (DUF2249 family)